MRFKKISVLVMLLVFLIPNIVKANDTFLDNNAITEFTDINTQIVVSEYNTGKIISKRGENKKVSVNKLPNYLALYLLTEDLRNGKTSLDEKITIAKSDDILTKYKLNSELTVKVTVEKANKILSAMSLNNTTLETLDNSDLNKSTAKNISFLTNLILKNYPELTEITKNPEFTLSSGEKVTNSIAFSESEKFRVLGLDYSEKNSVTYAYSGNTKLLITILNQNDDKTVFFDKLQKTYNYLFTNYSYKLALKAGTYTINNENISFDQDIYDLFYEKHSIKDVTYLLMNSKILLFQKYETISANDGTVFANFKSNDSTGKFAKVKSNFINDSDFDKKNNLVIDRTKYFATGILAVYSLVFMALYIMKQVVRKD